MAYIGNIPAEAYTNTVKDSFNGNGSTTAFTLSRPTVTNDVRVVVENVIQDPTVAYSVSGTTLTFTSAPPAGTGNIYVVHLGPAVMTAIPPSEIADATTFASSVTVQGAFTSLGIDDNATSTAMTLDSSGNLLVGKTSANYGATAGFEFRGDNDTLYLANDGDKTLALNRNTSDGEIISFRKNDATVGRIGVAAGDNLYIGSTSSGHSGLGFGSNELTPMNPAGTNSDGDVNLGYPTRRFNSLYLSGGVYLGGTGSANKLDDYEEGTFTPTLAGTTSDPTVTYVTANTEGRYTKIGNRVICNVEVRTSSYTGGSGDLRIKGFPFVSSNVSALSQGAITLYRVNFDPSHHITAEMQGGANQAVIRLSVDSNISANLSAASGSGMVNVNPCLIRFSLQYETNA